MMKSTGWIIVWFAISLSAVAQESGGTGNSTVAPPVAGTGTSTVTNPATETTGTGTSGVGTAGTGVPGVGQSGSNRSRTNQPGGINNPTDTNQGADTGRVNQTAFQYGWIAAICIGIILLGFLLFGRSNQLRSPSVGR